MSARSPLASANADDDHRPRTRGELIGGALCLGDIVEVLEGELPGRALRLVKEWGELHRDERWANWELAGQGLPLDRGDQHGRSRVGPDLSGR